MIPAEYSVIRYIPDLARNEALNIGILAWFDEGYRLRLDTKAVDRVIKENPWLATDALRSIESLIQKDLWESAGPPADFDFERLHGFLSRQRGYPVSFTDPRFTSLDTEMPDLDATVDRLLARIVRPRRRSGPQTQNLVDEFDKRFRMLIDDGYLHRSHAFTESRSGAQWIAQFYANSGTNLAFDTIKLAVKSADLIRNRAAQEAFKIIDISARNEVRYLVHCELSDVPELQETNHVARSILESAGAQVMTDVEEAEDVIEQALANVG